MALSHPIPVPISQPDTKFEREELPRILAALKNAHDAKMKSRVTIDFAENGGVVAVGLEMKKSFK